MILFHRVTKVTNNSSAILYSSSDKAIILSKAIAKLFRRIHRLSRIHEGFQENSTHENSTHENSPHENSTHENSTQRKFHPRKIPPNNRLKGGVYLT